jgi:hypothetical protein
MFIVNDPNVIILQNSIDRINITIQDSTSGVPVNADPSSLKLQVIDGGGNVLISDQWPSPSRIVRDSAGKFYIDFGYPQATLNGSHSIGATTLNVINATPLSTAVWPTAPSSVSIVETQAANSESLTYTALNLTAGTGIITLNSPTLKAHASGASVRGVNSETGMAPMDWLFNWQITLDSGGETAYSLQKVRIVSPRAAMFMPDLRQMIDKSHKLVDQSNDNFLGYTDSQIYNYLEGGLNNINAYQPSLALTLENFPTSYKQILIDAALLTGVMSQQLYAVDTDIPNYNDQGTSFVIAHQPQLASFFNQLAQRLDKMIPMMKLSLINPGSVYTQMGPNFRLQTLMEAAPGGSTFRNVFFVP